jgi:hypothetical protein
MDKILRNYLTLKARVIEDFDLVVISSAIRFKEYSPVSNSGIWNSIKSISAFSF